MRSSRSCNTRAQPFETTLTALACGAACAYDSGEVLRGLAETSIKDLQSLRTVFPTTRTLYGKDGQNNVANHLQDEGPALSSSSCLEAISTTFGPAGGVGVAMSAGLCPRKPSPLPVRQAPINPCESNNQTIRKLRDSNHFLIGWPCSWIVVHAPRPRDSNVPPSPNA